MSAAGKRKLGTGPYPSNSDQIKKEVFRRMREHNMNEIEDPESPGTFIVILDTLAAGTEGTHQPSSVANKLGLGMPVDAEDVEGHNTRDWDEWEWAWEHIEKKAGEVADELKKVSGLPGQFYFGNLEGWGDYCLFYSWEVKDHPEFDYSNTKFESDRSQSGSAFGRVLSDDNPAELGME
jgi:hypothetical protein